jgi:TRAP transporter TAXI family solute receptor
MNTRFRAARILPMVLALLLSTACGGGQTGKPTEIILYTGGLTGVYYQYGQALRTTMADGYGPLSVVATSGSVDNLNRLASGETSYALVAADAADAADCGDPPFVKQIPVRAIARLYDDYIHLVVPAGSPVRTASDLRGLRVSTGGAGSGTQLIANRILTADQIDIHSGIHVEQLGLDDSVTALVTHRIDAFFWSGGLPTSGVTALAKIMPIRLVDMTSEAKRMRTLYGSSYRTGTIPVGVYDGSENVVTIAVPNILVTLASTSDADARRFASALFGGKDRLAGLVPVARMLDPSIAIYTEPVPLHPGAGAYYQSIKAGI